MSNQISSLVGYSDKSPEIFFEKPAQFLQKVTAFGGLHHGSIHTLVSNSKEGLCRSILGDVRIPIRGYHKSVKDTGLLPWVEAPL